MLEGSSSDNDAKNFSCGSILDISEMSCRVRLPDGFERAAMTSSSGNVAICLFIHI